MRIQDTGSTKIMGYVDMKPEQLKVIAEYMGYSVQESKVNSFNPVWTVGSSGVPSEPYNPLTNAEQSMELLKMLLDNNYGSLEMLGYEGRTSITFAEKIVDGWQHKRKEHYIQGDSLEQAILNAMWEHVSNEQS